MREKEEREGVGIGGLPRAHADRKKEIIHNIDQTTTSFYFTNFPDDLKAVDLWGTFAKYGQVGDVYIPNKVDKRGKRFGFVKFKNVTDIEDKCLQLADVWCGSFKLWINHSRFGRNTGRSSQEEARALKEGGSTSRQVQHELTFKEALIPANMGKGSPADEREDTVFQVPVESTILQNLKRSFAGFLLPGIEVKTIKTMLLMEGRLNITVTTMGGNMVLLQSSKAGEMESVVRMKEEWLGFYFFDVKPWTPTLVNDKREVWVKVFGIPLHA
jgi:RNA recognition motif-containing protein